MNALTLFLLIVVAFVGAGCDVIDGAPRYSGVVAETRGQCHTIISDPMPGADGKPLRIRYALKAEDSKRLGLKAGQRVVIRGKVAVVQDCAAAVVLKPEA